MIYTIRTTTGREDMIIDIVTSKIKAQGLSIKSIFHPAEIKGYVFLEGNIEDIHRAIQGMMHTKGVIETPIKFDEIRHFIEQTGVKIKIDMGDIVEIIGGPFKNENGKVTRIDKVKDEVTVELLEAAIPIPVTIATEFVKITKKAKTEEKTE
jgi:transcriptional antiterminator NusG